MATMEIILKAIDEASAVAEKVGNTFNKTKTSVENGAKSAKTAIETAKTSVQGLTTSMEQSGSRSSSTFNAIQRGYESIKQTVTNVINSNSALASSVNRVTETASSASSAISTRLSTIKEAASNVAGTVGSTLSNAFSKVASAASSAATTAVTKLKEISQATDSVNGAISGVVAGFGLFNIVQTAFEGAMNAESNATLLMRRFGSEASQVQASIQNIVAAVPGDDTFMNQLLSGAAYKAGIDNVDVLHQMAVAAADYMAASTAMGKESIETQRDLKDYLLTGNTTGLEQDSILKNQLGTMKNQATVQDRIVALQKALTAEGYDGYSQYVTTANELEVVKGSIQQILTQMGSFVLPYIKSILSTFIAIDDKTGGWASRFVVIGAIIATVVGSLGLIAGPLTTGIGLVSSLATDIISLLVPSLSAATASEIGFGNSMEIALVNFASYITGIEACEIQQMGFTAALWETTTALLTNPIMWVVIAIVALVAVIYEAGKALGWWNNLSQFGEAILARLKTAWDALANTLSPITNALGHLYNAFKQVFSSLVSGKTGEAEGNFGKIASAALKLYNALKPVGEFVAGFLTAAWTTFNVILNGTIGFIASLINVFADLLEGNISLGQAIQLVWGSFKDLLLDVFMGLQTGIGGWLANILISIGAWAQQMGLKALEAGQNFLLYLVTEIQLLPFQLAYWLGFALGTIVKWNLQLAQYAMNAGVNFVNWFITQIYLLPGRLWTLLWTTLNYIGNWELQLLNYSIQAGSSFVNNFINYVTALPGRLWSLLLSALNHIASFAASIPGRARSAGLYLINGFINTITSLPGRVGQVLWNVINKITSFGGEAYNAAVRMASNIWEGFKAGLGIHSPSYLEKAMDAIIEKAQTLPDEFQNVADDLASVDWKKAEPQVNIPNSMGSTVVSTANTAVTAATNATDTATQATSNLNTGNIQAQTQSATAMVTASLAKATTSYNALKTTSTSTWTNLVNTQKTSLEAMKNNMATTLNNIVSNNTAGYSQIQTKTIDTLNNLQSKTTSDMTAVKSSWNNMRDSLVNAANNINSNVSSQVSHLQGNISIFYRKIRNPALLLAGPGPGFAGPGRIRIPKISGPHFAGPGPTGDHGDDQLRILDTLPSIPCLDEDGCYAGDWDQSSTWITAIMNSVNGYVPNFGDLGSLGLTTANFKNSTFPLTGNLGAFNTIASRLIGATKYSFYWNSRYGSPAAALNSGAFNCYDGALIMLALARAFGLSGYMAHGYWGNIGHVWAVIAGKVFDTTAFQHGYGWSSPKVHAGPVPSVDLGSSNPTETLDTLTVKEALDLNLNLKLEGVPDNIDQDTLLAALKSVINDSDLLKAIVKNSTFQDALKSELAKGTLRKQRSRGG